MLQEQTQFRSGSAERPSVNGLVSEQVPRAGISSASEKQEETWLLGQPSLGDYIDYVREMTIDGAQANKAALVDEWRVANDYYYDLEASEPNTADAIEVSELSSAYAPFVEELKDDPRFRNTFDAVPATFAMVELDRLIVFQKHVTGTFVDELATRLDLDPSPEELFRFCMPPVKADDSLRMRQVSSKRFAFSSDSLDLRFHEPVLLDPQQVSGYDSYGAIAGVLGLVVGFSSNFLSAVRSDKRLVLHNGYHRANALRARGITHAPCIIETVTRLDELNLVAKRRVAEDPAFYFSAARPPMLRDFFDPRIRKVLPTRKIKRTIEVSFEVHDTTAPD
jgi:hypothetical protein